MGAISNHELLLLHDARVDARVISLQQNTCCSSKDIPLTALQCHKTTAHEMQQQKCLCSRIWSSFLLVLRAENTPLVLDNMKFW